MNHSLRKSILLALIILTSFSSFSQISITSSNMPSAGDTIRYSIVQTAAGVDFKATGANKAWDFLNLKLSSQAIYDYKNSTSTPYIFNFGLGALGLKVADSLGSGQASFKNVYTFFKKSTAKWEAVGIGFQLGALPLPQAGKHTNTDEIYQFPLNYKDKDSATFALKVPLTLAIVNIGNYFQDGNRVNTVDGWGTISTPFKSNIACIRIKSVITESDSLAIAISGQTPINFAFPNNRVEYKWLSTTEKIPVLEVSGTEIGGTFTPTTIRYRDNYKTSVKASINSITTQNLLVYPNPANYAVTLNIPNLIKTSFKLFMFDMNGKQIENLEYKTNETESVVLNTSKFVSGKYTILINNGSSFNFTSVNIIK